MAASFKRSGEFVTYEPRGVVGPAYLALRGVDESTWRLNRCTVNDDGSMRLSVVIDRLVNLDDVETAIAEDAAELIANSA